MSFDFEVVAKLLSPLIAALVGAIAKRYFEARPKLISYLVHSSAIPLNDGTNTQINTHSIVVRNAGKKAAHNIRIGHNFLPKSFQIYPPLAIQSRPASTAPMKSSFQHSSQMSRCQFRISILRR